MENEIAPDVPEMPPEAIEFAKEIGELADKYGLREVEMNIRIDTGFASKYRDRKETITEKLSVWVSKKDGRGRPRTKISVSSDITLRANVIWEPDTSN